MDEAGERLRQARLRRGLELAEVAARLKIPPKTLRALEWGRLDLLPASEAARTLTVYEAFLGLVPACSAAPRPQHRGLLLRAGAALAGFAAVTTAVVLATLSAGGTGTPEQKARAAPPAVKPAQVAQTETNTSSAPARPAAAAVVLIATRGDSWVDARAGSATGRPLYQATLAQGGSIRLRAARIWLRLGAASNVDVTVNGKKAEPLFGTVEVVLTPAGLRPA